MYLLLAARHRHRPRRHVLFYALCSLTHTASRFANLPACLLAVPARSEV